MRLKFNNKFILAIILILATVLRFYKLNQVPFTFDEFSALFRTQFGNFNELIKYGVIGDVHPAGIQIFLYYMVKIFGFSEFWLKFPFVLFGILSVLLTYFIAKLWFNETVGLVSSTFIATLQFSVLYSQIARPYISGLFFCLFMVYFWSKYLFKSRKKLDWNLIAFVFGAILCSYNHYFSLLFALIVGLSGLFFIKKNRAFYYIGSGIIIILTFIPHLNITLSALKIGGLAWLGKPDAYFLIDYAKFIFHSSIFMGILIIALLTLSYFYRNKNTGINKFRILSLAFFIVPFIIGFLYSIFLKPVIQYSVLIFSFPFLIILFVSFLKEFSPKINLIFVLIILSIIGLSLLLEKKHYKITYQSGFYEVLKENSKFINTYGSNHITSIISSAKNSTSYYLKNDSSLYSIKLRTNLISTLKNHRNHSFSMGWSNPDSLKKFYEEYSIMDYKDFLANQNSDYLYYGWSHNFDRNILNIIPNYYPYLIYKRNFFNSEVYLFSKTEVKENIYDSSLFSTNNSFETEPKFWQYTKNRTDTISYTGKYSCFISKETEFSPAFEVDFNSILDNKSENVQISVKYFTPGYNCNALLVLSIENFNKAIQWNSVNLNDFIDLNKEWQTANLIVQIDKIHFPFTKKIKVYIWNPDKDEFFIDDFSVEVYEGNMNRFKY